MSDSGSRTPPVPKLVRLEAEIKTEADPVKRGCLRAERAGLLARQGSFDLAREALNSLQTEFGRHPQASVSIWMQIAEGWLAHYRGDLVASKDHLLRAHALSSAIGNSDLQALSAAWLAHLAYAQDSFSEMAKNLQTCKKLARKDDHLSQTRFCLVMAQAYHFANQFDLAQPWYLKARSHALIDKDDAALSVLSYNMAGRHSFHLVANSIFAESTVMDSGPTMTGIQSSYSFDQLFHIPLLGSWVHMIQAMAYAAKSQFKTALELYKLYFDEAMKTRLTDQIAFFKADIAWCNANLNMPQEAKYYADEAQQLVDQKMYVEDGMITFGRLAQVYSLLGLEEAAKANKNMFEQNYEALQKMRNEVIYLLSDVT